MSRLAHALQLHAERTLPLLDDGAREEALNALADFVATPLPSRFLRAARTLAQLARRDRQAATLRALGRRAFERAAERLDAVPALAPFSLLLTSLPADAPHARRLDALAVLVATHQELAGRLRDDEAQRKARFAELAALPPERRRRRG